MNSTLHSQPHPSVSYGVAAGSLLGSLLAGVVRTPGLWWKRHQTREHMLSLDDHLLRDIGLTRTAVLREWQKAFWEV